MGTEEFLSICKAHITEEDFEILKLSHIYINKNQETKCDFLNEWYLWECSLRNELVKLRAANIGESEKYIVECPIISSQVGIAAEAVEQESPLIGEDILNKARWAAIDELETGHYFDIEKLISYYLKLQILERKGKFDQEIGFTKYKEIYEKIIKRNQKNQQF